MREVIDKYASMPFSYGADCCQFAAECFETQTGENPIADLSYRTKRQAYVLIKQYGGLEAAVTHFLGEPSSGAVKDGDLCLISANDGSDAIGVIYRGRIVARVKDGLMDYPLERAKVTWCI